MKKILSAVLVTLLLASCGGSKNKLELNLEKDKVYNMNTSSSMVISQKIEGNNQETNVSMDGKLAYKVTGVNADGYDMEVSYLSLGLKMKMGPNEQEFNSEKKDTNDVFSTLLGEMTNKPFLVKITKKGRITEVKNIEQVFSGLFNKYPTMPEEQKKQIMAQLMQSYGEKPFKGSLEMGLAIFPDIDIEKGGKWTVNTELSSGTTEKVETTYELKDSEGEFYIVSGTSKITTADTNAVVQSQGMDMQYNLSGTMTSEFKLDKKSGWISDCTINQDIKGMTRIKANEQMPDGMVIPMSINNKTSISGK